MKKRWKVLLGMIVLVFVLAACAKEADTYKEGYLGDAAIEQDGTFDQIGTAEEGWEDAREQALKEATSGGQKAPAEAFDRAKAEEVVRLVNEERKRLGLNELVIDEAMMTAAETRAKEQKTLFSHTRPDGTKCFTVFDQFEIPANYRGENLASGGKCTPAFVMKMWIASEGHYANIKNEKFNRIGVGYFESGKYGYWAQLFAN
ncbi:MAG: hypothetical protein IKU20_08300 [Lachnospiraceae bacterium]|nr:hypothetical protein [Lachnospiraceae bacterium]